MKEKYSPQYESQIRQLAENRLKTKNFKIFDHDARIVKRADLPELVENGRTDDAKCLVIVNSEGETIVITKEFELVLTRIAESWFEK